ncbi:hypothetical protein LCGC14_0992950 [marine sediment metagenome]|uniref:Uncharacterized protein n=1 Tax=marine sediment metagenome TaxID=412755 RepID=A0A0F9NRP8_9ZZZZ
MKTPYDQAIAELEAYPQYRHGIHWSYGLNTLKGKRQGWLDAEEKYLPLLRGMLKITEGCGLMLEHKITDEEIALLKRVEEVVGL